MKTSSPRRARQLAIIGLVSVIAACGADTETSAGNTAAAGDGEEAAPAANADLPEPATGTTCPVLDSRNWTARVEERDDGERRLRVAGEIDLPTPGFVVKWQEGPADRRMPPAQHLLLELTPPDGMVTQVVTTETIEFESAATYPEYRSILVRCGDQVLAAITDIQQ